MTELTVTVPGISCGHCTHTIETELGEFQGVHEVRADVQSKRVSIKFDTPASEPALRALLAEIGYPAA